jgi:hypothetical protein
MKLIKLTALPVALVAALFAFTSCEQERNNDFNYLTEYKKTNIVLSGAQEVPANASPATGSMDVTYSKKTKTLNYTVRWNGLTDSVLLMHIHGLAPIGFNAGVVQNIVTATNGIFPQRTAGKLTYLKSGSLSGSLLVDGVVIKEDDLLNGMYYMNIHTPAFTGGEIRAQVVFQ